jgi:hypothetical protein
MNKIANLHTQRIHFDHCGLLLHSRFSNLPFPLLKELYKNLLADVEWVCEQVHRHDEIPVATTFKNMSWIVYTTSILQSSLSPEVAWIDGLCKLPPDTKVEFCNPEDELILKHAVIACAVKPNKNVFASDNCRIILIIKRNAFTQFVDEMLSLHELG